MASYQVVEPSITKLTELAYISKNLRFYEEEFKTYHRDEDELNAYKFRRLMDDWLLDNLLKGKKA